MAEKAFTDFVDRAAEYGRRQGWRRGQAHFVALYEMRPDLSEQIRGSQTYDPYYDDQKIAVFVAWVREHWEDS